VDLAAAGPKGEVKEEKPDLLIMNYEPDEDEVLDAIIPKYVSSLIYGAFLEAVASENGARMTAMDSATNNAEEMIGKLSLQYNRARQGSITQELTEIIECHRWLKRNMSNYLADLRTCGAGGNRQHTGDRNQSA
jgi:F-type H+-transporting ATPase subunit gamma